MDRLAPSEIWILRLVDHRASRIDDGDDHVEGVVELVVLDVRRIDAVVYVKTLLHVELALARLDVSAEVPVGEILRMPYRNAREISERAVREIVVIALARDGRIGSHSIHYRIAELRLLVARR